MNRLELDVNQTGFNEQRQIRSLVVQESFEGAHAIEDELGWRRNEGRSSRAGSPDPVLAFPELARLFVAAPTLRQKDFMDLPDEPQGKRKAPAKPLEAMVQRGDVVGDFLDVVQRTARHLVILKEEQVGKRRLSPLDLGFDQIRPPF